MVRLSKDPFKPHRSSDGSKASASTDGEPVSRMHPGAFNRSILLPPLDGRALISPDTTGADIDDHTQNFRESVVATAG